MSTKVRTRKAPKLPPGIIPAGDGPGLYRVRYADGTLSDVVNLARAREALMKEELGNDDDVI